jgi:uncharacterized OB-fold protein
MSSKKKTGENGGILKGQYCPKCARGVNAVWLYCPMCGEKLKKGVEVK